MNMNVVSQSLAHPALVVRTVMRFACAVLTVATMIQIGGVVGARGQAPSVLRAGTDLVTIDVQITAVRGTSIREFTPADFAVDISGRRRPLASATLLHYDEGEAR